MSNKSNQFINSSIRKSEFSNEFLNFINALNEIKIIDLSIFSKNLKTLKIQTVNSIVNYNIFSKDIISAYYEVIGNTIIISRKYKHISFNHELFHVASSYYDKETIYCGLSRISCKNTSSIGKFLNEGYTELLTQRYFPSKNNNAYTFEKNVAGIIEDIVGRETMYECYFKANLPKLITCLSKYSDEKQVLKFLSQKHKLESNKIVKSFVKDIYFKKLKEDFKNGLITRNELISKIKNYLNVFEKCDIDDELFDTFKEELLISNEDKKKSSSI